MISQRKIKTDIIENLCLEHLPAFALFFIGFSNCQENKKITSRIHP